MQGDRNNAVAVGDLESLVVSVLYLITRLALKF